MANHVQLALRKDFVKNDGTRPVSLILTINRRKKRFSTGQSVASQYWDIATGQVIKNYPEKEKGSFNLLLKSKLKRAENIIFQYELHHKQLTFDLFEAEYLHTPSNDFYSFVIAELESHKNKSINRATTATGYLNEVSKMKQFRQHLKFIDITVAFLSSYEGYMREKLKNKQNTIHKSLKFIRTFINRAYKQGIIKEYVFDKYALKTEKTQRSYLTIEELQRLEQYCQEPIPSYHRSYLKIFLFCCRTGLRYSDVKALKHHHIFDDKIVLSMHKTNDIISIPLDEKTKALFSRDRAEESVFKVPTNQVLNRHLRTVFKNAGINKELSFHSSRHTFATIGITLGIPIDLVSKLCGHRDIKTTMIYVQYSDELKKKEYAKWGSV